MRQHQTISPAWYSLHPFGALVVAALLVPPDVERFVTSQNICLFKEQNDLSSPGSRKSYDDCMMSKGYVLRTNCPATATNLSCYEHATGPK
jgi:hypothetical protein